MDTECAVANGFGTFICSDSFEGTFSSSWSQCGNRIRDLGADGRTDIAGVRGSCTTSETTVSSRSCGPTSFDVADGGGAASGMALSK